MRQLLPLAIIAILTISLSTCSESGTGPDPANGSGGENGGDGGTTTYSVNVDVTPGNAGSISPAADGTYDEGEEIELEATANDGYIFSGWSGDIESTQTPYSLTVDQDYSITANFEVRSYELTVNTEGEGTVDEAVLEQKSKEYEHGTVVELTANPAEGYAFVEWQGDVTGSENPAQITIDDPKEVTAVFEKKSYALTVTTDGEGAVSEEMVQQKPTDYEYGTVVELTANPAEGWKFVKWTGANTGSDNPIQVTVDSPKEVTAVFEKKSFGVTVNTTGDGTVSKNPNQQAYSYNSTLQLEAAPATGYQFVGWQGDLTGTDNPAQIIVDDPKEVIAVFEKKKFTVSTTITGEGTITRSPDQTEYVYGSTVDITANPVEGWKFVEWQGDVTGSGNPAQITVDDSKQVTAVFQKKTYILTVNTTGQGSVAKDPEQQEYEYGTNVEVTASPASGWNFEKWEGDIASTENPVQLTVDGTKDITAVFVEQSTPLFYLAANGVTIKCENAQVGDSGTVNGVTYTKRTKSQITFSNAQTTCTSGITDMGYLFYDATSFNADISSWDVSSVVDMGGMFFRASSFNADISNWDVGSVTDMSFIFSEALSFNIDLDNWDVSNVTDMENMFDGADLFNQDLSSWNVGNVTTMQHMFRGATSFNGNISSWNVGSVTNMRGMFSQANSFNRDISTWNVSNVIYMDYMFASAASFNQSLNSWDVSSVVAMDGMFQRATSFNGDISSWNVGNVEPMDHMFEEAESFNRDIGSWDVSSVTNMEHMFNNALSFNQDLSGWCVSNIGSYPNSFAAGTPLESSHIPVWGTCP